MTVPKLAVAASGFGGRGYRIPTWLDDDGKPTLVPSITTVNSITAKPAITQWAVDQTAAYAVANIDALLSRSETQGFGMLRWYHKRKPDIKDPLRTYHQGVLDDAAELGTNVHEYIEADLVGGFAPEIDSREMAQMVDQWHWWRAEHTIEPLVIEGTVVNREHGYAGTLDLLAVVDGVPSLIDVKTSRNTWAEHWMQLAALSAANYGYMREVAPGMGVQHETKNGVSYWVEDFLPPYSSHAIIHLRPDDVSNSGDPIPAYCRMEYPPVDLDFYWEEFKAALAMTKAKKNREMEEKNGKD